MIGHSDFCHGPKPGWICKEGHTNPPESAWCKTCMTSPSRARPSDRAIAQAYEEYCANYAACIEPVGDTQFKVMRLARELETSPEARAGDCDALLFEDWWNASKYRQVVVSSAADMQIARDAWNAALTTKATP